VRRENHSFLGGGLLIGLAAGQAHSIRSALAWFDDDVHAVVGAVEIRYGHHSPANIGADRR
jgi:hypothetical protein